MPSEEAEPWQVTSTENLVKTGCVVYKLSKWTDKQTDILITILRTPLPHLPPPPGGVSNNTLQLPAIRKWTTRNASKHTTLH